MGLLRIRTYLRFVETSWFIPMRLEAERQTDAILATLIQLAVGAILEVVRRHSFGEAVLDPLRDNHGIDTR
jgi:hypothetical protein